MRKMPRWLNPFHSDVWRDWAGRTYRRESYQKRLAAVQAHLSECLDLAPPGPVRIVSMCAGDGRDVIGVLQSHPRRKEVSAWLVEMDAASVAAGKRQATQLGLQSSINFVTGDATLYETYTHIAPSDIVLVCGVWGHVPPDERARLARAVGQICKPKGTVIWTRGLKRGAAGLQEIQQLFAGPAWDPVRATFTPNNEWAVATYRHGGAPAVLPANGRIFNFRRHAGNRTVCGSTPHAA